MPRPARSCTVEGCDRKHWGKGLCLMHYGRIRRGSGLGPAERVIGPRGSMSQPCRVEDCEALAVAGGGLCWKHYARLQRNGDPTATKRWMRDADPGLFPTQYGPAHQRVSRVRGPASSFECADCGGSASDWSYNLDGVAEMVDGGGRRYSLDPAQYDPRCRPCHRRYDASRLFVVDDA